MIKYLILFVTFVYFSEGKNCPELTKAHLTRCDMYYKCVILPSSNHVWIPTTCNKGLVYEHSLRICVLPADDWECTLGDTPTSTTTTTTTTNNSGNHIDDNKNIYGINNLDYLTHQIESYRPATQHYIHPDEFDKTTSSATDDDNSYIEIGGSQEDDQNKIELNETYEVLPYNMSHDDYNDIHNNNNNNNEDDDIEYSGDGSDNSITYTDTTLLNQHSSSLNDNDKEDKEGYIAIPLTSDPNASVASHLQRLTQLIDSLQKSPSHDYYNNYTTQPLTTMIHQNNELNANDLNTILAHHNIQSEYEHQQQLNGDNNNNKYSTKNIYQMSDDGKINPNLLSAILDLQTKLQDTRNTLESHQITTTTTVKPDYQEQSTTSSSPFYYQSYSKFNHGSTSNNNNNNNGPDSTKIRLQSINPFKDSIQNKKPSELGYSTSQIVVNRPEGSVVFTLPGGTPSSTSNKMQQSSSSSSSSSSSLSHDDYKNEPYITQDTLKTILELSKQMVHPQPITAQQPYVPEQNFLQPIFRPIYYNIPIHDLPIPIINNYEKSTKENDNQENDEQITDTDTDNVISQQKHPSHNNKFEQNEHNNNNNNNHDSSKYNIRNNIEKRLPNGQSTIIHNNIPITIEGPRPPNNKQINKINGINKESTQPVTYSDNTAANDPNNNNNNIKFDSYGVKITPYTQNYNNPANVYPEYPPLQLRQSENVRPNFLAATPNEYGQLTNYYTNSQQQQDQQQPPQLPNYNRYNPSAPASGQIPSNIIDNQYIQISPPQYYRQEQSYSQSPVAYSPNFPVYYTPSPHLNDKNVNNYINFNTKLYPTIRPSSSSSSSSQQPYQPYQNQITSPITTSQQQYLTSNNQQKTQVMDINGSINTNTNNFNNNNHNNNNNNNNFEQQLEDTDTDNFQDEMNDDADDDDENNDEDMNDDITDNDEDIQSNGFMQEKTDDSNNSGGNSNNILGAINGLNVIDLLTNLKDKQQLNNLIQSSADVQITNSNNNIRTTSEDLFLNDNDSNNKKKVVNVGGQFISYDAFKNSIYPLLQNEGIQSQSLQSSGSTINGGTTAFTHGIEVLTCTTGVRQPNQTDCTKYFVCNAKTGNVVTYSCPQFTAFNSQTHLCEAKQYAECNPMAIRSQITIDHNKKIQYEAQQALQEANRIKAEALRTKQLATLIKLETQNLLSNASPIKPQSQSIQQNVNYQKYKPTKLIRIGSTSSGNNAIANTNNNNNNKKRPIIRNRKRLIPCRAPGKIKDTLSKYNYFVCFKGTDGKLRARKMICPNRLTFCPSSRLCTTVNGC